jgi:hypothetical protein
MPLRQNGVEGRFLIAVTALSRNLFHQNFIARPVKIGAVHRCEADDPFFDARLRRLPAERGIIRPTLLVYF